MQVTVFESEMMDIGDDVYDSPKDELHDVYGEATSTGVLTTYELPESYSIGDTLCDEDVFFQGMKNVNVLNDALYALELTECHKFKRDSFVRDLIKKMQ